MKLASIVFGLAVIVSAAANAAVAQDADSNFDPGTVIQRFHRVDGAIFRGARPGHEGLEALAHAGFKTDLDLDNDSTSNEAEAQDAAALGLNLVSIPLSGFWAPKDEAVNQALAVLADAANYPVFVHCQHGEDRTGLIVGLYRVEVQHWTPHDAYEEMKTLGFHTILLGLNHYFEKRTSSGGVDIPAPGQAATAR